MNSAYFYIVFLCETATMLPFRVLSYYPFRRQLRFPWQTVVLIVGGSQLIQSFLYAWVSAHGFPARGVEFAIGVSCLVIYLTCIRADRWKVLFLYIFIFDYLMITRGTAYFIEARLFEGFQPPPVSFVEHRGYSLSVRRDCALYVLVFAAYQGAGVPV